MVIRMEYHLYDDLVKWAREHLPEEACGLLAGTEDENGREIKKVYFLENKDHAEDPFPDGRASGCECVSYRSRRMDKRRPSDLFG